MGETEHKNPKRERCCCVLSSIIFSILICVFIGLTYYYHNRDKELEAEVALLRSHTVFQRFPAYFLDGAHETWYTQLQMSRVDIPVFSLSNISYPCDVTYSGTGTAATCRVDTSRSLPYEPVHGVHVDIYNGMDIKKHVTSSRSDETATHISWQKLHFHSCCEGFQYWMVPKIMKSAKSGGEERQIAQFDDHRQLFRAEQCRVARDCKANCQCIQDEHIIPAVVIKHGRTGDRNKADNFEVDWFKIPTNCRCRNLGS